MRLVINQCICVGQFQPILRHTQMIITIVVFIVIFMLYLLNPIKTNWAHCYSCWPNVFFFWSVGEITMCVDCVWCCSISIYFHLHVDLLKSTSFLFVHLFLPGHSRSRRRGNEQGIGGQSHYQQEPSTHQALVSRCGAVKVYVKMKILPRKLCNRLVQFLVGGLKHF